MLEILQSRPGLTGPELAARLETDVRTVRRYVSKLQDVGIPIESHPGRHGGYRLRAGYKLPPLIFDEHEAAAIVLGLLASPWLEIEQSQAAVQGALSKITRVLPTAARDRVLAMSSVMVLSSHRDETKPDASLLMLLADAVHGLHCVHLTYLSEGGVSTRRTVEPYGLVGRYGRWYLVGFCRLRVDFRTFRLDRIREARPIDEQFTRKKDFDFRAYALEHLTTSTINWTLVVVFTASMARVREMIPASLGTLTETPGGIRLDWPIDDIDYGARYLLGRGIPFTVQGPPELRTALRKLAEEATRIACT